MANSKLTSIPPSIGTVQTLALTPSTLHPQPYTLVLTPSTLALVNNKLTSIPSSIGTVQILALAPSKYVKSTSIFQV